MAQMIFINLPVSDLEVSKNFYTGLGYEINESFSDENAASIVISDTITVMLLVKPFFQTFTTREIADATKTTETILALSADSAEEVDELVRKALASGGSKAPEAEKHEMPGMHGGSFCDPDGHYWEVVYMDPAAIPSE
ncbi:VOC family protein [Bounagaea algeriensis]